MAPSSYDSDSTPSPQRHQTQPARRTRFHVPNHGDLEFEEAELERLRMSMEFPTMAQLVDFVRTSYVISPLTEFIEDYLHYQQTQELDPPSLDIIIGSIITDTHTNTGLFTMENPDKTYWAAEYHWARFIQQVYRGAQAADSPWTGVSQPDFAIVAWQLFELLQFVARRWLNSRP